MLLGFVAFSINFKFAAQDVHRLY